STRPIASRRLSRSIESSLVRRRNLQQHVCEVPALRYEERMRHAGGNMDDVAGAERMTIAAVEPRPDPLARGRRPPAGHGAAELQRSFTALHEHDVDDSVVLLGIAIGVAVEHAETVVAIVGQRLA